MTIFYVTMLTHIYSLCCASLNAFTILCSFSQNAHHSLAVVIAHSETTKSKSTHRRGSPETPCGQHPPGKLPTFSVHFPSLQVISEINVA
jgi:hypothetical protein